MADDAGRNGLHPDHHYHRQDAAIGRYWDAIAEGRLASADPDLDPRLERTIRRVHALAGQPVPDPDFADDLWRDLMHSHAGTIPLPLGPGATTPNGHTAPSRARVPAGVRPARAPGRAHRLLSAAAAAALAVAIVGLTLLWWQGNNQATPPAVPGSPTAPTAVASPEAGWLMFGGNAARDHVAQGPTLTGQPVTLWTYRGAVVDHGAAAGGMLYLPTGTGDVVAIDAATGTERWRAKGFGGMVVVDGDGLIVQGGVTVNTADDAPTDLARLNRADGSVVWQGFTGQVMPSWNQVVRDGLIYTPLSDGTFAAIDARTGELRWSVPLANPASRGASLAGGLAVLGDQQGTVAGIATAGGDVVWTTKLDATTIGHPTMGNGVLFVNAFGGADQPLYALDAATGAVKWRFVAPDGSSFRLPAYDGTTVYLPTFGNAMYALDAATGALKWTWKTDATEVHSPIVAGDMLLTCTNTGNAYALDAATGQQLWTLPLDAGCNGQPIYDGGTMFLSTDQGTVYAITSTDAAAALGLTPVPAATPVPSATATAEAAAGAPLEARFVWATNGSGSDRLVHPLGIRRAPDGRLWVNDLSGRFFIFDLDGNLEETWGTKGSGPGEFQFQNPDWEYGGIAFAPDGSFYVADPFNYRVQHFDKDRNFLGAWGSRGSGDGQFQLAFGIAVEPDGNVLVTDAGRLDIQRFGPDGRYLGQLDGTGTPEGRLVRPTATTVDADGRIYVVEQDVNRVRVFDHDGNQLAVLGQPDGDFTGLSYPGDVAIDEAGYVYVADQAHNRIVVFAQNGRFVFTWGEAGTGDGQFDSAGSVAVNRGGTVYVVDWHGNRIQKFKLTGPFPTPADATPVS